MLRKLLIAAYLLTVLALAGLWVRSGSVIDSVCVSWAEGKFIRLTSSHRRIVFQYEGRWPVETFEYWQGKTSDYQWPSDGWLPGNNWVQLRYHPRHRNTFFSGTIVPPDVQRRWPRLGVEYVRGGGWVLLSVPHWMVLAPLVLVGPPVWWLSRVVRRARRRRRNLCVGCAYDLRGSIDAGATTCPECGRAVVPSTP